MSGADAFERLDGRITFSVPRAALAVLAILVVATLATTLASLVSGSYELGVRGVVVALVAPDAAHTATTVVRELHLPRTLVATLAGALLALSGATLQNVTRNPLADPSLVGVSQGAGFAVVVAMIAFPSAAPWARPLYAFGGALAVAALIQWIAVRRTGGATMRFILTGIGVAAFISAGTGALLTYGDIDRALAALGWLAGSVHAAGWGEVATLSACTLALLPVLLLASRPMSALRMGPELASGLGVRVRRARAFLITLSVALAAAAVAAVGPIGFVGLVAPHAARRLARSGVRIHLALSAAVGGLLVLVADLIGRTIFAPVQIPAGLVTAVIGAPVFVALILGSGSRSGAAAARG